MTLTSARANDTGRVAGTPLADLVGVGRRFLRSVNLERDFYTPDALAGYVLTPSAFSTLERLSAFVGQPGARAWTITGAYGSGKSAFALLATKVLALPRVGDAAFRERLRAQSPALWERLALKSDVGFWPVLVTGAREPMARALLRGLRHSLRHLPEGDVVERGLAETWEWPWEPEGSSARDIAGVYEDAAALLRRHVAGCKGLVVVVDEMGKFLEYAALHPEAGDTQVLQEMAEQAARSKENPVLLITILHQAFEEYASKLGSVQRVEWQKVQGRFLDVAFGDSPEETLRLLGQAIEQKESAHADACLAPVIAAQREACRGLRLTPPSVSASEFRDLLRQTFPLHPLTALILPYLFRRFGQSERTLFSFLSSQEPGGFQEFLNGHILAPNQTPLFCLDHLYDYATRALGASLYSHGSAKLWSEIEESLYRLRDRAPLLSRIVKTIGLLQILGEQTRILPSADLLVFALGSETVTPHAVETALNTLSRETLIVYRRFRNAYRLYEGSDVDVETGLREAHAYLTQGADSVALADQVGATPPLVARRHSYETGTLRFFAVRCCRPAALEAEISAGRGTADGLLLLCLAADASEIAAVENTSRALLVARPDVIVGVNVETPALHEAATQVECLLWVQDNTPELSKDNVAKREVRERLQDATNAFSEEWDRLLRPRGASEEGGAWFHNGARVALGSYRQLQALVSRACDATYPHTPRLRNELINRRQLSSTAASARRVLIEGLIERRHEPRLGIEGFPPEASMYVSVLENTGIHREAALTPGPSPGAAGEGSLVAEGTSAARQAIGEAVAEPGNRHPSPAAPGEGPGVRATYALFPPDPAKDAALAHVWQAMETFLFGGILEAKPLTELNARLQAPPFGLADGLIPVLLCALLLAHENEVVVYEEGRFVTELDAATFERLIKRPEDYRLQGCRVAGERQAVLARFAAGLLKSDVENTLVNVVRALYRQFSRLPEYTLKTRALPAEANALRDVFKEGREPEQLLFVQLPRLLGARPFVADEDAGSANVEAFFARWNPAMRAVVGAYDALLSRLETTLCQSFGVGDGHELRARAAAILPFVTEARLKAFALRAADDGTDARKWLESVAAGVVGRPPVAWSDAEEERFAHLLAPLVSAFQHSELLWFEKKQRANEASDADEQIGLRLAVTPVAAPICIWRYPR